MKTCVRVLAFVSVIFSLIPFALGQAKRNPDSAFDSTQNRYLMVWEEVEGSGSVIKAQFKNPDGTNSGSEALISDPRPTQGCFYGQFDEQNGDITTPSDCPENKNPSVAYNNGQYLISWEVHGSANAPSSAPDNQFINIFAQVINADTLEPLPGWEEGILISKVYIAANNAESSCGDKHACNDGQIQAWSKSKNSDIVPNLFGQGFLVTWQTNKDYIGCADAERRGGWAVYGRYIDENFSATSTTNPPAFSVFKDDSTMADFCEPLSNVDNGTNPRIAVNETSSDFVIVYEVARANGGNASVGAKRVTLNGDNVGQVTGSLMPDIVASVSGSSLNGLDVISYKNQYVVFASDGSNVRGKAFASDAIAPSEPVVIDLGDGSKTTPRASSNMGIGGERTGANSSPERILLAFEKDGDIFVSLLDEALGVVEAAQSISSDSTENQFSEISSDVHDFLVSWQGDDGEVTVFSEIVSSESGVLPTPTPSSTPNVPPTAPSLISPANSVTYAPTRTYLSWSTSSDSDGGTVTYNVYFGEGLIPATPQITGLTDTYFVIGPETEADTGITLEPSSTYQWKVEASDGQGGVTSSPIRTINTDNSVIAWWRFDEDPTGPLCTGGAAGETVCDYSGNDNHGIPVGGVAWLAPPNPMLLGGALDFDGSNDTVTVQNNANLNFSSGDPIAIEMRVRPDAVDAFVLSKGSGGAGLEHGNYSVISRSSYQVGFTYRNTDVILPTYFVTTTLTPAVYNHVSFSYSFGNGGSMKAFINGVISGGTWLNANGSSGPTGNENPTNNSQPLAISGRSAIAAGFYNGTIDDIIIFDKTLSNDESVNHFEASVP